MIVKLVGIKPDVSFKGDNDRKIEGDILHLAYHDNKVHGVAVESKFITKSVRRDPLVIDQHYEFVYDVDLKGRAKLIAIQELTSHD